MADTFIDDLDWLPDELITSTKLNQWWANMQNFHNGTALGDGIILTRHVGDANITSAKLAEAFIKGRLQSDTTNTTIGDYRIQMGWGFIVGNGVDAYASETVTFPQAFSAAPIVLTQSIGWRPTGSTPTSPASFTSSHGTAGAEFTMVSGITSSQFNLLIRLYVALPTNQQQGYTWIAIGPA